MLACFSFTVIIDMFRIRISFLLFVFDCPLHCLLFVIAIDQQIPDFLLIYLFKHTKIFRRLHNFSYCFSNYLCFSFVSSILLLNPIQLFHLCRAGEGTQNVHVMWVLYHWAASTALILYFRRLAFMILQKLSITQGLEFVCSIFSVFHLFL